MAVAGYKFIALTGGGAGALDSQDGAGLNDGDIAIVMDNGSLYHYQLDEDSGVVESFPNVIAPDANAGNKRWILQRVPQTNSVPVGSIVPFVGGYFANNSNGSFVNVLGNDATSVNNFVNNDGWYVCDGAELNLSGSPIYDGSGRHLPNLTDDRFVMGDSGAGAIGGTNISSHIHSIDIPTFNTYSTTLSISQMPAHAHELFFVSTTSGTSDRMPDSSAAQDGTGVYKSNAGHAVRNTGGGGSHYHAVDPPAGNTSTKSLENRPKFLSVIYIQKVI